MTPDWQLGTAVPAFIVAAGVIAVFGSRLARVVDRLADRSGVGEALAGAVILGGATSLAGLVVSVVAAASGEASLAISNSLGGIAVQTAFIVVLDMVYRRANLEHAAASLTNLFSSLLMILLLAITVLGVTTPPVTVLGVHPATVMILGTYVYGMRISRQVTKKPMWRPEETRDTRHDEPDEPPDGETLGGLWVRFALLALVVAVSGLVVGRAGLSITAATGLSGTLVAVGLTSIATSLPELVTGIAAVRAGALTLAVGGIVGGNSFDTLFIAAADIAYQEGSLYAAVATSDLFVVSWTMLLTGILAAGLVRRQHDHIGFEGFAIIVLYLGGLAILSLID